MNLIPAHVVLSLVYGAVSPYLSVLIRNLGYSAAVVGIMIAVFEGAGLLGPILISRIADKYGKFKWCIILSFILTTIPAMPLAVFARPLFSAVLVAILGMGYRSSAALIEALTTLKVGTSGVYGKIRATGSLAFVCFVLFLQWIPVLRPNTAWNIALWIVSSSVLSIIVITLTPMQTGISPNTANNKDPAERKTIWTPFFILGLLCIAFSRLAMASVYSFLSLFVKEYMLWDAVGIIWALACLAEIPCMFISHRFISRFGAFPVLAFTSAMVALRLAIYAIFPFKAGVIIAQLLHSFCFGMFHPAAVAFISDCLPPEQRAFGMSIYLSVGNGLPVFIGSFIGGFIVDYAGYRALYGVFSIFAVIGALTYFAGKGKKRQWQNSACHD